jgi:hypothetical protein
MRTHVSTRKDCRPFTLLEGLPVNQETRAVLWLFKLLIRGHPLPARIWRLGVFDRDNGPLG